MTFKPYPGLTIACALLFALLCGLGAWQVERLQWKLALIARVNGHMAAAPLTLDQIAAELRVSATSVQRSLAEQGLTYKDAVETMRQNLARMYLEQRQLPLTEVALLLGYSELSAFTRAFTRWTGVSPRIYRQSLVRH